MFANRSLVSAFLIAIFAILFSACGGSGDSEVGSTIVECEADPVRVAARDRCLTDDSCPCGTFCDLGLCLAQCTGDGDCSGSDQCNSFGQCQDQGRSDRLRQPSSSSGGDLKFPFAQRNLPPDEVFQVDLIAGSQEVTRARVIANLGVQIRCPDSGDWSVECELFDIPARSMLQLDARAMSFDEDSGEDFSEADIANIEAITASRQDSLSLHRTEQRAEQVERALPATISGTYEGRMRLMGIGSDRDLSALARPATSVLQEINATIWESGDDFVIEIEDGLNALSSRDSFIGSFTLDAPDSDSGVRTGSASFPVHPFIETTVGGRDTILLSSTVEARVRTQNQPRRVSLEVTHSYLGAGADVAPSARWIVELTRDGGARGEPAAIPRDAEFADYDPVERLLDLPPWQDAFGQTVSTALDPGAVMAWYEGDIAPLVMCDAEQDKTPVAQVLLDEWMSPDVGATFSVDDSPFYPFFTEFIDALEDDSGSADAFSLRSIEFLAPDLSNSEIPCDFAANLEYSATSYDGEIDFCDQASQHLGCAIEDIPEHDFTIEGTVSYIESGAVIFDINAALSMSATRVCRLPDVASNCAEGIFCMNPDPSATGLDYVATAFDSNTENLAPNGDLRCAEGGRSATFAFDINASAEHTVVDAVDECIADLQILANIPPNNSLAGGPGFDALYADVDCVDVGRLLTALQVQTSFSRGPDFHVDPFLNAQGAAYTQRLLSRWLTLHAFLANEAAETEEMIHVFTNEDPTAGLLFVDIEAAKSTSLQGWDLLLSQEVLHGLLTAPQYALEVPDYRFHAVGLDTPVQTEQKQALAAVILETLEKQSILINKGLQSPAVVLSDQLELLREFTPRSIIAQALAADIYERTSPDESAWHQSYDRAARRLQSKSATTYRLPIELADGSNTLGIADSDLPLYFQASSIDGASQRFAAVSDFIAGDGPGSSAWAPAIVALAKTSLDDARDSFVQQAQRDILSARYDRDIDVWGGDVRTDLNATLRDFCGPVEESLIDDPNFSAAQCAIDHSDPTCVIDLGAWYQTWRPADLQSRFCMHKEITNPSYDNSLGFEDPRTRAFADRCPAPTADADFPVSIQTCEEIEHGACLRCDADTSVPELPLFGTSLEIRGEMDRQEMGQAELSDFNNKWNRCERRFPSLRRNIPLPDSPLEKPYCLSGSLGEAYLDLVSADFDIQEARQSFDDHLKAYDIAMKSCYILRTANDDIQENRETHRTNMENLRTSKSKADNTAAVAGGVKECAATLAGADFSTPWGGAVAGVATAASCVAGGVETGANIVSMELASEMESSQELHEMQVANIEADAEIDICFNDAKMELVGLSSAAMSMERAAFDFQAAQGNLTGLIDSAQLIHSEGSAYLLEEELYTVPSPAGDRWTNERVRRYSRDMKLARRATYLAVRAVEYEYQQSLGLRQDVLDAQIPDELETVLQELWRESGTRSIRGNRPTELSNVLSLRQDILQIGDESDWPDAERPQTPQQRFQIMLTSDRYAVYDDDGRYTGQRIPFSLTPLQALGFENDAVSIYSVNDCAERLWSVNASLIGEELYRGSDTSFVRIDLLKRNTFYSQWCGQAPEGEEFQYASVRPARNLFREPGVGQEFGPSSSTSSGQGTDRFSRARIQAFFGVGRAALEDTRYANGETSELAARGIYGDYALFIPAELIARDGGNGLVLENIDDILLRLDYLSVASD